MDKLALILLSTCFFAGDLLAGGIVLHSRKLPTAIFRGSDIDWTEVFIDAQNNTFIIVMLTSRKPHGTQFLYSKSGWVPLKEYGGLWNAFLKDGQLHLAMKKDENLVIYKVQKDIELVSRISIAGSLGKRLTGEDVDRVIPFPGPVKSYYLLACRSSFPVHPWEFLKNVLSAGHGIHYRKPFLIEVADEKLAKPRRLRYGGKIDESYYIRQVAQSEDLVHFLGFRRQEQPAWGPRKTQRDPVILHHAAYDLKKKKVIQTHAIYTNSPETDTTGRFFYMPLSMDALGNDVFVAFAWVEEEELQRRSIPINNIKWSIFYWEYSNGVASDVEKIADGFLPLVRVDSSGSVHSLWIDKNTNLVHKAKRNGKWGKDTVLVNNLDVDYRILDRKCVAAEFDKDNNLHVVYPFGGNLVHSVVKVTK